MTMLTELERAALEAHASATELSDGVRGDSLSGAVFLGLRLLLEAGRLVREQRTAGDRSDVTVKGDGSPVTEVETAIESRLHELLSSLGSEAAVVGEETGGDLPNAGLAFAIDPIDGTWAFLSETETYSTTLALIRDRQTVMGMVANPVTGEIAYATEESGSRILRLPVFGEPAAAHPLPGRETAGGPALVSVHPSRRGGRVMTALYRAWEDGEIDMVRSAGGSPAWAMVEAARGHFVYLNLWSRRAAAAYDLAAAAMIVGHAGGVVADLDGRPADALEHAGPFIAGIDRSVVSQVAALVRDAAAATPGAD